MSRWIVTVVALTVAVVSSGCSSGGVCGDESPESLRVDASAFASPGAELEVCIESSGGTYCNGPGWSEVTATWPDEFYPSEVDYWVIRTSSGVQEPIVAGSYELQCHPGTVSLELGVRPTPFEPDPQAATGLQRDASADDAQPQEPLLDMARLDGPAVQGYANRHGVTPEQAREIIIWQSAVTAELGRVTATAGDRYAGARFLPPEENDGEALVAIYIADPTSDDYDAVADLAGAVLVEAFAGQDELDRVVAEAHAAARAEHPDRSFDVLIDPETGNVEIEFTDTIDNE